MGGLRLLNAALVTAEPLARLVLAISAVEALGQSENWTPDQVALIEALATQVESQNRGDNERAEVADALRRGTHRIGLRQGVLRILRTLQLEHLKKEWDRIYGERSKLVHGVGQATEAEIAQLATDAIRLGGQVLLAICSREGVVPPSIATSNFHPPYSSGS